MVPYVWRNLLVVERQMVGPWSWTMWSGYGLPLGACGILPDGGAWAFLGPGLRPHMLAATRRARRELEDYASVARPAYAEVDKSHPEALRWVRLLGFRHDAGERWVHDEVRKAP